VLEGEFAEGDHVVVDAKGGDIVFDKRKESVTVH
jgi:hypothetical protein